MTVDRNRCAIYFDGSEEMTKLLGYARNGALLRWKNCSEELLKGAKGSYDDIDSSWFMFMNLTKVIKGIENGSDD